MAKMLGLVFIFTLYKIAQVTPQVTLDYKPTRPFYHPNPFNNLGQIVPPGKPWPASPQGYQSFNQNRPALVDRIKETVSSSASPGFDWSSEAPNFTNNPSLEDRLKPDTASTVAQEKPQISLEYKPMRPWFHPNPGDRPSQIIPPGQPWPDSPEGYQNFSQIGPTLADRFKETTSTSTEPGLPSTSSSVAQKQPPLSLGYKPMRPWFHPNPGDRPSQIVPPGQPWPDSPEGYQNFSQIRPTLADRFKQTTSTNTEPGLPSSLSSVAQVDKIQETVSSSANPGFDWSSKAPNSGNSLSLEDRLKPTTTSTVAQKQPQISLEYKPMRPFYHPNPGDGPSQIVPPGQPWPDSPEGYQNFSQIAPTLADRFKETTSTSTEPGLPSTSSSVAQKQPSISLEYKPMRPFYHPNPGDGPSQIVPPGQPWPDSPESYNNFSQIAPTLADRFKPTTSTSTELGLPSSSSSVAQVDKIQETVLPGASPGFDWSTETSNSGNSISLEDRLKPTTTSIVAQKQPQISLEYKPMRPFYHPNPGDGPSQIIPPGQPWPNSPEGYQNFSQVSPTLADRFKETTSTTTEPNLSSSPSVAQKQPQISLEYKPMRPFYHPNSGNGPSQIVPPGQPWPDSPEGYQNFSQIAPTLADRFKETTTSTSTESSLSSSPSVAQKQPPLSLEYKPMRPWHHPNPGDGPSQIVPPGQPWPDSPEAYQNFSQTVPTLMDRFQETVSSSTSPGFDWSSKAQPGDPSLNELNITDIAQKPSDITLVLPPGQPEDSVKETDSKAQVAQVELYTSKPNLETTSDVRSTDSLEKTTFESASSEVTESSGALDGSTVEKMEKMSVAANKEWASGGPLFIQRVPATPPKPEFLAPVVVGIIPNEEWKVEDSVVLMKWPPFIPLVPLRYPYF